MDIKMPLYETMIFLFTGVFFCVGIGFICPEAIDFLSKQEVIRRMSQLPTWMSSTIALVMFYEIGRVLNYVAQVLNHRLLCRFIGREYDVNYVKYNLAQLKFPKIEILSRERTVARLHFVIFLIYAVVSMHTKNYCIVLSSLILALISLHSYGRFVERISKLVAIEEKTERN